MRVDKAVIISLIALGLSGYLIVDKFFLRKEIAYVNFIELYEKFEMKKELEASFKKSQLGQKKKLDSLNLELTKLSREGDINKQVLFENLRDEYYMAKEQYDRETDATMGEYKMQIFKQLEQYSKEYGKKNNFECILGSEGSVTLLYKDELKNITNEVLDYANKRYKGQEQL